MKERLHKLMARAGVASRRASEELILAGRVAVNGEVVRELGIKVDPASDLVAVDGRLIHGPEQHAYYILHKPRGVLTTVRDDRGRRTVMEFLQAVSERVYPVGRLDYDSEGLLILTNDGRLANRLMHPRYQVPKFYMVKVAGQVTASDLEKVRKGVELEDGPPSPAYVQLLSSEPTGGLLRVGSREGRNRQIRRMCQALGFPVKRLIRTQIGPIKLGSLAPGACRRLTGGEVRELKQAVGRHGR